MREGEGEYPKNVKHRKSFGGRFDGHLNQLEMREKLQELGYTFEDTAPTEFYGIPTDDCLFLLLGGWFDKMRCTVCDWTVEEGGQHTLEYEKVVPNYCPECEGEIKVEKSSPERLETILGEE